MRHLWLSTLTLLAVATTNATASPACFGPWVPTYVAPAGCPIVVFARDEAAPTVELRRNGQIVAATSSITTTALTLDVAHSDYACGEVVASRTETEAFVRHDIDISDALPGDEVLLDGTLSATFQDPGTCLTVEPPQPECTDSTAQCEDDAAADDDDAGCSAGRGRDGLPLLLALSALSITRRKRRAKR